jgi:hypothetical protein
MTHISAAINTNHENLRPSSDSHSNFSLRGKQ